MRRKPKQPFEPSTTTEVDEGKLIDGVDIAALRNAAIGAISKKLGVVLTATVAVRPTKTADHKLSVICLPSKRYTVAGETGTGLPVSKSQRSF